MYGVSIAPESATSCQSVPVRLFDQKDSLEPRKRSATPFNWDVQRAHKVDFTINEAESGAPNEKIVQNHLKIASLNVF